MSAPEPVVEGYMRMVERQSQAMDRMADAVSAELSALRTRLVLVVALAMVLNTSIVVGAVYLRLGPAEVRVDRDLTLPVRETPLDPALPPLAPLPPALE